MTAQTLVAPGIARTERGLVVAGTRLTLYTIMDFIKEEWARKLLRDHFELTNEQIDHVLTYIDANREGFEAEYQEVLRQAEELRLYYEERNREILARVASLPPKPEQAAARAKLAEMRAKRQRQQGS
jgi:uncharacterized protein (DUF433 family)